MVDKPLLRPIEITKQVSYSGPVELLNARVACYDEESHSHLSCLGSYYGWPSILQAKSVLLLNSTVCEHVIHSPYTSGSLEVSHFACWIYAKSIAAQLAQSMLPPSPFSGPSNIPIYNFYLLHMTSHVCHALAQSFYWPLTHDNLSIHDVCTYKNFLHIVRGLFINKSRYVG